MQGVKCMLFIASKRYKSFDLWVTRRRAGEEESSRFTAITVKFAKSELREKEVPCSWYVKRLAILKGVDLEAEVLKKLKQHEGLADICK